MNPTTALEKWIVTAGAILAAAWLFTLTPTTFAGTAFDVGFTAFTFAIIVGGLLWFRAPAEWIGAAAVLGFWLALGPMIDYAHLHPFERSMGRVIFDRPFYATSLGYWSLGLLLTCAGYLIPYVWKQR